MSDYAEAPTIDAPEPDVAAPEVDPPDEASNKLVRAQAIMDRVDADKGLATAAPKEADPHVSAIERAQRMFDTADAEKAVQHATTPEQAFTAQMFALQQRGQEALTSRKSAQTAAKLSTSPDDIAKRIMELHTINGGDLEQTSRMLAREGWDKSLVTPKLLAEVESEIKANSAAMQQLQQPPDPHPEVPTVLPDAAQQAQQITRFGGAVVALGKLREQLQKEWAGHDLKASRPDSPIDPTPQTGPSLTERLGGFLLAAGTSLSGIQTPAGAPERPKTPKPTGETDRPEPGDSPIDVHTAVEDAYKRFGDPKRPTHEGVTPEQYFGLDRPVGGSLYDPEFASKPIQAEQQFARDRAQQMEGAGKITPKMRAEAANYMGYMEKALAFAGGSASQAMTHSEEAYVGHKLPVEDAALATPVGESLDWFTKQVASLPALPAGLLHPDAIAAMLITHAPVGLTAEAFGGSRLAQAVEAKFGPKVTAIVGNQLKGGMQVGAFSGAQTGLEGGTPGQIAESALQGFGAGQFFALPSSVGGLHKLVGPLLGSERSPGEVVTATQEHLTQNGVSPADARMTAAATGAVYDVAQRAMEIAPEAPSAATVETPPEVSAAPNGTGPEPRAAPVESESGTTPVPAPETAAPTPALEHPGPTPTIREIIEHSSDHEKAREVLAQIATEAVTEEARKPSIPELKVQPVDESAQPTAQSSEPVPNALKEQGNQSGSELPIEHGESVDDGAFPLPEWMRGEPHAEELNRAVGRMIDVGGMHGRGEIISIGQMNDKPNGIVRVKGPSKANEKGVIPGTIQTFDFVKVRDDLRTGRAKFVSPAEPAPTALPDQVASTFVDWAKKNDPEAVARAEMVKQAENAPPPAPESTVKPKGSLTRSQIEQELVSRHEAITGGYDPTSAEAQGGGATDYGAGTGKGSSRTFYKKLPAEITDNMTKAEIKAAGLEITNDPSRSGAEDYAHDIGWDNYIDELKGGTPGVAKAKEFFRSGDGDPEAAFLSALHDVIAGKKKPPKMGTVDHSTLKEGDTFTVAGKQIRVEKSGSGENAYLVLKDGEDFPTTPVDAMGKIPVDKGSKEKASGTASDPAPAARESVAPQANDRASPADAKSAGVESGRSADAGGAERDSGQGVRPSDEPQAIGLNKADIANLRETYDFGDAPEQQVRHTIDVLDIAKRDRLDETAEANANRANEDGRPLSDEEYAGAVVRRAALEMVFRDKTQEAREAEASGDSVTAEKARQDAETVRARINSLADAIDLSTSSAGRSLGIIARLRVHPETVDLAQEIRVFEKAKRGPSTSEERAKIESLTKILVEAQKDRDAALKREAKKDAALAEARAGQILKRQAARQEPGRRLVEAKTKLALERNQIRGQLLSLTRRANDITGIAPEALYLIGKLAVNHIRDGALTLAEVARRVKEDAKDAFPDMTDDDVNLALLQKDPARQAKAKDLTEKRVEALKREAALTQKLAAQAEKLKAEAPARSMEAQTRLVEQQIKLNDKSAEGRARKQAAIDQRNAEKAAREKARHQARAEMGQMRLVLDQLKMNAKATIDAGRRRDAIIAKIDALSQHLAEHSRPIKGDQPAPTPPDIAALRQQADAIRHALRTEDTLIDLQHQIDTGDFKVAAKIVPRTPSTEVQLNQIKITKARQQLRQMVEDAKPKTTGQKVANAFTKWVRIGALSHPTVLAKLTGAAAIRTLSTPIEQVAGYGISKVLPRLADQAPREGVTSARDAVKAEAAAQVRMWTDGIKGSVDMLRNRQTTLELEHNDSGLPPELSDYLGRLHGALKNPTKENEYARSLTLRTEHAIRNGVDVSDPIQQMRLSNEAYQDSDRSIFLQDNKLVDAWNRGLAMLEAPDKTTGKPTGAAYLASALRAELPIVKVPTNVVHEASQILTGMLTGPTRAAFAYARGIENLKPIEADSIMRQMKKGSIGLALLALGFYKADSMGGFYQKGEKRDNDAPQVGDIGPVPHVLLHNPYMEVIQFGATVRKVADGRVLKNQEDPNGYLSGLAAASMGLLDEVPFVRETTQIDKLLDPKQRDKALGYEATSKFIPGAVQWIAKQTDRDANGPIERQPKTGLQAIEAAIPGLRQRVPPKEP